MVRLQEKDIYLDTLERDDCKKIWVDFEYDFEHPSDALNMGHGNQNVRLGIFLNDGTVIGDVALQDIDKNNRSCTVGLGIAKIMYRSKGYGKQAVKLILQLGFSYMGMERITANTLEHNMPAQKSLEKLGFILEGKERKAVYMNGRKYDRLCYAMLREEFSEASI